LIEHWEYKFTPNKLISMRHRQNQFSKTMWKTTIFFPCYFLSVYRNLQGRMKSPGWNHRNGTRSPRMKPPGDEITVNRPSEW